MLSDCTNRTSPPLTCAGIVPADPAAAACCSTNPPPLDEQPTPLNTQTLERCNHVTAQPGFEPQVRCATPLASECGGSTTLPSSSGSTIAEQHDRRAARSSSSTIAEQHDRRAARPWVRGLYWGFEEALGRPRTGPLASLSHNLALNQRNLMAASTHGRRCGGERRLVKAHRLELRVSVTVGKGYGACTGYVERH